MKKSKVVLFSLLFALTGAFNTFASTPVENPNEIREEILELVQDIDLSEMDSDTERVHVQFLVNNKSEIIVLNVDNSQFDNIIKAKLNYEKVESETVVRNKIYTIPVVFQKK